MRIGFPILLAFLLVSCSSSQMTLADPISHTSRRATPLHFGLHVTPNPEENPIDPPERFEGFHVGLDFEVGEDELEEEVPIFALCTGKVVFSGFTEGYGGLASQRCRIQKEDTTVLYGHLTLEGLPVVGTTLSSGERIGILAPARTYDSDQNRKHLHLGIHRGKAIDFRGYVQTEEEVSEFLDPASILPSTPGSGLLPDIQPYWQD